MKKVKIGFIGIGLMGYPMAKNLLKSKYQIKVFNRTKNKAFKLKKFGAEVCNSLKEVVSDRDLHMWTRRQRQMCIRDRSKRSC